MAYFFKLAWETIKKRPLYLFGFAWTVIFLVLWAIGPYITPYNPMYSDFDSFNMPPSAKHLFGTDQVGMDIFSRVIAAPRVDLTIAFLANMLSVIGGSILGVITGYYRTWWSEAIARVLDLIQVFPSFILAMTAVVISGQNTENLIIVIGIFNMPIYARLVRSKVYAVRESKFVEAAICTGNSDRRILFRHILPSSLQPAYIQFSVVLGWVILLVSSLSFVGVGVRPPTAEWGAMISNGVPQILSGHWWIPTFPGIALGLCVLSFGIMGEALNTIMDPTRL